LVLPRSFGLLVKLTFPMASSPRSKKNSTPRKLNSRPNAVRPTPISAVTTLVKLQIHAASDQTYMPRGKHDVLRRSSNIVQTSACYMCISQTPKAVKGLQPEVRTRLFSATCKTFLRPDLIGAIELSTGKYKQQQVDIRRSRCAGRSASNKCR